MLPPTLLKVEPTTPLMTPLMVMFPPPVRLLLPMPEVAASTTAPPTVAGLALVLMSAPRVLALPMLARPEPLSVSGSAFRTVSVWPLRSSVAPAVTVVPAVIAPSAAALPSFTMPCEMVNVPEKSLAPLSVSVFAPVLARSFPARPDTTPLSVRSPKPPTFVPAAAMDTVPPALAALELLL